MDGTQNPQPGASVTVLDCTCEGDRQQMDFEKVTLVIDCATCGRIALGISNASLESISATLEFLRANKGRSFVPVKEILRDSRDHRAAP